MNGIHLEIAFWGSLIIGNVWAASHSPFAWPWIIFAIIIRIISFKYGR